MAAPASNDEYGPLFRNVETKEVGIDYLTITSKVGEGKKALVQLWLKHRAQLERLGDTLKKQGFQGYQGEACGPLMFGRKEDSFLLKLSSGGALELFSEVPWEHCHCSRIDLEVTIQLPSYNPLIAKALSDRRKAYFARIGKPPKPIQEYPDRAGRGDEFKIGSRESPRYGRVYDKWKESKDERYLNCWRWEVEYKGVVAPKIVEFLLQEKSLHGAIQAALLGQFDEWGIEVPIVANGVLVAGSIGRRAFDSERVMNWLGKQVAPSIERLSGTVDRESILEALGLAQPSPTDLPPITAGWLATIGSSPRRRS